MRKALCVLFIALVVGSGAADCKGSKPNPKKSLAPKPTITAQEVKACVDSLDAKRRKDSDCDDTSPAGCCDWRYLRNQAPWPLELPAVGETVEKGRGFLDPLPGGNPVTIPPEGAFFQR